MEQERWVRQGRNQSGNSSIVSDSTLGEDVDIPHELTRTFQPIKIHYKKVFENKNNTHNNAPHRGNRGSILIPEFDLVEKCEPETPNVSNDQMYQHNMTPAIINNQDLDSCTNPSIASLQDSDIQQLSSPKTTHRKVTLANSPSIERRLRKTESYNRRSVKRKSSQSSEKLQQQMETSRAIPTFVLTGPATPTGTENLDLPQNIQLNTPSRDNANHAENDAEQLQLDGLTHITVSCADMLSRNIVKEPVASFEIYNDTVSDF